MSELVEKIYADCALNQGPRYLERFLAMHARGDDGAIVVPLRAPLAIAGMRADLEKSVEFVFSRVRTGADMIPKIAVRWEPVDGGPFPTFEGTVSIEGDEDYTRCAVVLRGNYEPPLGIAGKTFDAAVGGRIARATAREFLERIREFIEAAYRATERAKKARERGFDG